MRNSFTFLVISLCCWIVFTGCSEDDDNGSSPTQPQNHSPVIQNVTASPTTVSTNPWGECYPDERSTLTCIATDADLDSLTYYWFSDKGSFRDGNNLGVSVVWCATATPDSCIIHVTVSDGIATDEDSVFVKVQ